MPKVSSRGQLAPESPIRKLIPYAEAAQKRGTKVYFLNIGQPDLEPPTQFWEAILETKSRMVAYSHSLGNASLRKKARESYAARGIHLEDGELFVTTAGSEALLFGMLACLEPGDEVIVPEPLYANYIGFAAMAGVVIKPILTKIEEDFALPGIEAFAKEITPRTRAILICNPNNPTGAVYTREQLNALGKLALKHDLYLFADEVYRDFNYTGTEVPSVLQIEGAENHVVCVDSVSKRFSLCGARIGFFMTRNKEIMSAAVRFAQARLSPPVIEQIGVEAALSCDAGYYASIRTEYMARRDALIEGLRRIPGVVVPQVDGAFYVMAQLPIDDSDRFCQWMLEEFESDNQTVMMAPGTGFYATPGLGKREVRIAYVLEIPELEKAITVLAAGIAAYSAASVASV